MLHFVPELLKTFNALTLFMKKFIVAFCNILLVIGIISCSKKSSGQNPEPHMPVGKVTPVGTVLNEAVTKQNIGPAGGSFTSEDGRITLEFPAGALTEEKEISITPITDQNPMGGEKAYRLQPHGLAFLKPVKIRFNYDEDDYKHSIPEALKIAFQDAEGIWQAKGGILNKANKTYTINTTHFSDWSFFESFKIVPADPILGVNETVQLEVKSAADLDVPIDPDDQVPVGEEHLMTARYIKKWKLAGSGSLQANGAKATYKAPGTVPNAPNPVAVTVELDFERKGQFTVLTHITIEENFGEIEVSVGGGPASKRRATPAVKIENNIFSVSDMDGDNEGSYIFIMWEGGVGAHPFRDPGANRGTHAHYETIGGATITCYYVHPVTGQMIKSPGGVTITNMGDADGYVEGTFEMSPAGISPDMLTTTSFSGKFKVKRGF